jgi:hypothetical protein
MAYSNHTFPVVVIGYLRKGELSIFKTSNIKKELNEFVLSYKKHLETYSKLDSPWLPLHPIIQQFKEEISLALFVKGNNTKEFENVKSELVRVRRFSCRQSQ